MSNPYTKHNPNPLYYCLCLNCRKARAIVQEARRSGRSEVVLTNPETGEQRKVDVSPLLKPPPKLL